MTGHSFAGKSITEFMGELSSKSPTPGGGGASALAGALAASLGSMVANLTVGKEKYREYEDEILRVLSALCELRDELLGLADRDAEAFAPLAAAYRLPSGSEDERRAKALAMEPALLAAALTPLEIMRKCAAVVALLEILRHKGSAMAVSDVACGAALAYAAMRSAWANVLVNTKLMENAEAAERINGEGRSLTAECAARAESLYADIEKEFRRA